MNSPEIVPRVLFGAFDRHNVGDWLFPHLLAALLPPPPCSFAGLAARDFEALGGHQVRALADLADSQSIDLIHVGGELLTCTAYEAAVMLLDSAGAAEAIARYDRDTDAAATWSARQLASARLLPYVVGRDDPVPVRRLIFNAVGGVGWPGLSADQREPALAALRQADWISVRDHVTQSALRQDGIDVPLCPDVGVMVKECAGPLIERHRAEGPVAGLARRFPQGFLACQFSAEFGDDATLRQLAGQLTRIAEETRFGLVLFRAGAAPWHDDAAVQADMLRRLPPGTAQVFDSLHLWDICALIAASRGVIASSLHARIVALAYALPRVSLTPPQQGPRPDKRAAFAETWEPPDVPRSVTVDQVEAAVRQAFALPASLLRENAALLGDRYRQSLGQWLSILMHSSWSLREN